MAIEVEKIIGAAEITAATNVMLLVQMGITTVLWSFKRVCEVQQRRRLEREG